jgi:hypothetical protein
MQLGSRMVLLVTYTHRHRLLCCGESAKDPSVAADTLVTAEVSSVTEGKADSWLTTARTHFVRSFSFTRLS